MLPPNWVIAAFLLALCLAAYGITCIIERVREQRFLHAVFDGDRIQQYRNDRYNRKHIKKLAARNGRRFY